ncbi:heavy-metal-associated domain-containing protein [Mannheimia varigena]|uniref:heavy-metal-associated domain-containing protein n=1 Tax=Mannheimia varigena TaxID=85404 RepID=UPI0015B6F428|nr:heavy metal-associated domain-containing protein [Mannheimia varigena]MDY2947816.1 heavy metal-associated domain-containing protein [Mannheimia varigena]QLD32645.1 heavy-metal-associated domain-containing protein [Mannheimia varigena]
MTIKLQLDGLHCSNCVKSVEKALNEVAGVTQAIVTLENQTAIVQGDVAAEDLIAVVEDIGFEAKLA